MTPEPPPVVNPRKRKAPPEGDASDAADDTIAGSPLPPRGEYETGRVICEVCGEGVSFRDESTGGFTLKHWDAHRQQCANTTQAVPEPVIYTPESTAEALANPPPKRRRAKRTEEERIDYLRADPYVAQFEAYRVLCASCDKWIRLRPNSTYCSIPWDAHRKSCLSKKMNTKNGYALDERNAILSKDPDVRKFDAERILCNKCDRRRDHNLHRPPANPKRPHRAPGWLVIADDVNIPPRSGQRELSALQSADVRQPGPSTVVSASIPKPASALPVSPSSSFKDLTPTSFPPAQESRRRNAEQRAATLRADPLIDEVEPNRVFCTLCKKWVQLRQDSSYCAYPWLQHRTKCLARHERRAQKAAQTAESRTKNGGHQADDENITDGDASAEDELESDGAAEGPHENGKDGLIPTDEKRKSKAPTWPILAEGGAGAGNTNGRTKPHSARSVRPKVKHDADMHHVTIEGNSLSSSRLPRRLTLGFADLDSVSGRTNFIYSSIAYLFMTTYEPTDEMTISSLLAYLNAAMPPDKHEDFDTAEVAKAVAVLQDRGDIIFEGDMLRLPD
ncbi:hypothetical protein ID866_3292 [Astraeus odoratus]|nr:hypothetical protein ID866_3292 [Astraeus odoratus]